MPKVEFEVSDLEYEVLAIAAKIGKPRHTSMEFARLRLLQALTDEPVNIGNALNELIERLEAGSSGK